MKKNEGDCYTAIELEGVFYSLAEIFLNINLFIMILLRDIFLLIILCLFENSDYFCIRFSNKVHTILNPDVSGDFRKEVKKLVW